jgi:hypothetical protein
MHLQDLDAWWQTYCRDHLPSKSKSTAQYWPQVTKLFLVYYPDDNTGRYRSLEHHDVIPNKQTTLKVKFKLKYRFGKNGICDLWTRPWGEQYFGFTTNYSLYYPILSKWINQTEKALEGLSIEDVRVMTDIKVPEAAIEFSGSATFL